MRGLEEWNREVNILEEQVDDCQEADNRELGEIQVNNELGENQLENPQCELSHRNGKFSRERSHGITEKESPGMRKSTPKRETYN